MVTQSGVTERVWDKYLELRPQIIDLEASLAEEWLPPELMSALRAENIRSYLTEKAEADRQAGKSPTHIVPEGRFVQFTQPCQYSELYPS